MKRSIISETVPADVGGKMPSMNPSKTSAAEPNNRQHLTVMGASLLFSTDGNYLI